MHVNAVLLIMLFRHAYFKMAATAILSTGKPFRILHVLPQRDHRRGDVVEDITSGTVKD